MLIVQPPEDLSGYAKLADIPPTAFVNAGAYMPVATLLADYPAGVANLGKYGRVSDLWGSVRTVMTCEYDGNTYYWRPQRTDYSVMQAMPASNATLVPLIDPPVAVMGSSGSTLLTSYTLTPSVTNAWPGAKFTRRFDGLLGVFSLTVAGLVGGGTVPLVTGQARTFEYTSAGWKAL